ncbi:MAG: replication initiator protein A [Veillonella parvula]|uniref:Replication initiator protein A n=1 Tax=Veillonella parvula TaxID=29466 RepID=A0A942WV82_VEIPA|nr:replication initiator protein A [Veillonella parvula]MBS4893805.1 replication initiator protein A [Veillonella parvula]
MDNVDNFQKVRLLVENDKNLKENEQISFFKIKEGHSFNETNLMTLPFISLKKKEEKVIERSWKKSNNEIVSIKVVGGEHGVPQIAELDVLLALFRIHLKNNNNGFYKNNKTLETQIPKKINFTYALLARELGYKQNGGALKKKLEKSIRKLNEVTIYTKFAILDAKSGEYISKFNGLESCGILNSYCSYSKEDYKRMNNGQTLSPYKMIENQSIEIDDFFLNNMCNNYYKVYDYEKYKELKMGIAKKLFLILSTWSKGNSKFLTYQVLADYIGIDFKETKDIYNAKYQIKKAVNELVSIGYIDGFEERKGEGIEIIFNKRKLMSANYKDMFLTENEMIGELRQIGIDYDEIGLIFRNNDPEYIAAMLRMMREKTDKGERIKSKRDYFLSAMKGDRFNLKQYMNA